MLSKISLRMNTRRHHKKKAPSGGGGEVARRSAPGISNVMAEIKRDDTSKRFYVPHNGDAILFPVQNWQISETNQRRNRKVERIDATKWASG